MLQRCRGCYPVRMMCRCLKVSSSGYYAWEGREQSLRSLDNARLLEQIRGIHANSDGVMGSPRVWEELRYRGEHCSLNRVARLMKLHDIVGIPQKRKIAGKKSGHRPDGVNNHLRRDFNASRPETKWVTDITYVRTGEGYLYLAAVIDLYSKLVVGWSMSPVQDRYLVIQAVLMAVWQRKTEGTVILHSDRGTQFTSGEYQHFLQEHNLICSMSAVGSCADNAAMEGFFGMLKRERVNRRKYVGIAQARADIFDYIERFYNPIKRRKLEAIKRTKSP